jgi:hypothetical protein
VNSGTGVLKYTLGTGGAASLAHATVQTVVDGTGALHLTLRFSDAKHGAMTLTIAGASYTPAITLYPASRFAARLETTTGAWVSSADRPGIMAIRKESGNYLGSFGARNFAWQGTGNQPALSIDFLSFSSSPTTSTGPAAQVGDSPPASSACTLTWQIGTNASQTVSVSANIGFFEGELYVAATWNDSSFGQLNVSASVPYTGTGTYSSVQSQMLVYVSSSTGMWVNTLALNPCTIVNVIAITSAFGVSMLISMNISGLPWASSGTQEPALNLNLSAFAVNVGEY